MVNLYGTAVHVQESVYDQRCDISNIVCHLYTVVESLQCPSKAHVVYSLPKYMYALIDYQLTF